MNIVCILLMNNFLSQYLKMKTIPIHHFIVMIHTKYMSECTSQPLSFGTSQTVEFTYTHIWSKILRGNTPKIIYGYVAGQQPNHFFSLICYLLKLQLPRYDFFTCVSHTFSPPKYLFFLFFVVCMYTHTVREVTMFMLVYLVGTNTSFYLRRN